MRQFCEKPDVCEGLKGSYCEPEVQWLFWLFLSLHPWQSVDEIDYPFPNFKGGTIDVWEWISILIKQFIADLITYPCCCVFLSH